MNTNSPAATEQHQRELAQRRERLNALAKNMRGMRNGASILDWLQSHSINVPDFDIYQLVEQFGQLDLCNIDVITGVPVCKHAVLQHLVDYQIIPFSVPSGLWDPIKDIPPADDPAPPINPPPPASGTATASATANPDNAGQDDDKDVKDKKPALPVFFLTPVKGEDLPVEDGPLNYDQLADVFRR